MTKKVAIVTGANKGIGFATVRGLCKKFDGDVFLTARDESRGQEAVAKLQDEGLQPRFHQLDINDVTSCKRLAAFLKEKYGGVDVLVNNAAIAYMHRRDKAIPLLEQAENSVRTNYYGTLNVCNELFPLLRNGARVVNVSSMGSGFGWKKMNDEKRQLCRDCKTVKDVGDVMDQYVADVKSGNRTGWPNSSYSTSKVSTSLITPLQQQDVDPDNSKDIVVNCCCPGYVGTDMNDFSGTKTIDEGADTPIYLALLPPGTDIRGQYVSERKVTSWRD